MGSDRRGTNLCASTVGRSARVAGPLPQQGQDGVGPPGTNLCASTVGRSARVAGPLPQQGQDGVGPPGGLTCVPLLLAGVPGLLVRSLSRGRMGSDAALDINGSSSSDTRGRVDVTFFGLPVEGSHVRKELQQDNDFHQSSLTYLFLYYDKLS